MRTVLLHVTSLAKTICKQYALVVGFVLTLALFSSSKTFAQGAAIGESQGATPDQSAILDLQTSTRGFLVPRLTAAQMTAIASPAVGLLVYNTTTNGFMYYNGAAWNSVSGGISLTVLSATAPLLYNNGTGAFSLSQANGTTNGYLSSADWTTFNSKEPAITAGTTAQYWRGDKTWQTLNTTAVPEGTNLYYTDARTIAAPITGYVSGAGVITAADNILTAIEKLNGNIVATGSGTVTSFSAGTLNPLFTTSVATSTTTPALTFTLSNAGAYTILGNNTSTASTPTYFTPTLASALFANQGTTTGVLHGNAAGNPSWGAITLSTDVTGILPIANGGTNASTAAAALTNLGGIGLTSLSASAPITYNNGTGVFSIPVATGAVNGYLASADWTTFNSKMTNPMTTAGDIIYGGSSGVPSRLAAGTTGQVLTLSGGVPTWTTPSGGSSFANPTATIGLTAVNGVATTAMRSDAAPALDVSIVPTWTGAHTWNALGTFNLGLSASGAAINLNASSNFATNINTGTSTGVVTIGNSSSGAINLNTGAATNATTTLGTTGSSIFASSTANSDKIAILPQSTSTTAGFTGTITSADLSANRTWTLPDATGTLALSSTAWLLGGNAPGGASVLGTTDNSAVTFQTGTGALNLGTDAAAKTITIGNTTGATGLSLKTGTGNFTLDGIGSSTYTFGPSTTTGTITIGGTSQTGNITVGASTGAEIINIGTGTGANTVNIATNGSGNVVIGKTGSITFPILATKGIVTNTAAGLIGTQKGTGVLKDDGTGTITYDNSTYLTPASSLYVGTTSIALNRASAAQSLTGITSIDGNAAGLTGGSIGLIPYQSAANTTSFLAAGTSGQVLTSGGVGAPTWTTPANGTVTSFSAGTLAPLFTTSVATSTTTPALSFALSNAGAYSILGNSTNATAAPSYSANPVTSSFGIAGSTSGVVSIKPQAAAGTYNFNLPTTAGTAGQVLTSGGGGATPMTWGTVPTSSLGTLTDAATITVAFGSSNVYKVTPLENETLNATGGIAGGYYSVIITSSGTTPYTLTFGTNFKTTGTLATGTTSGAAFVISFVSDGTTFYEVSRTTGM